MKGVCLEVFPFSYELFFIFLCDQKGEMMMMMMVMVMMMMMMMFLYSSSVGVFFSEKVCNPKNPAWLLSHSDQGFIAELLRHGVLFLVDHRVLCIPNLSFVFWQVLLNEPICNVPYAIYLYIIYLEMVGIF